MGDRRADGEILAAGAVIWRPAGRGVQVALVHRPKYDDWSFAKGKVGPGEHILLAALREVEEETGLRVTLGRNLAQVRYPIDGLPKRIDYWAARVSGAVAEFVPNSEVDRLEWVAPGAASRMLSYPHDVKLLADFAAGPRATVPLIVMRHASAGRKSRWHKSDDSRPLDARGKQQAKMLGRLLACFGPARGLSSPAERCVATLRPFAEGTGAVIEAEPAFAIAEPGAKKASQEAVQARADEAVKAIARAAAAGPTVICAHRENIPMLLTAACRHFGAEVPSGPPLRKGEFWVLHHASDRLAGTERHRPEAVDDRLPASWPSRPEVSPPASPGSAAVPLRESVATA
jgi:8-oxo-dGTP pyrophosphatase MutT (NUDIX family)/phosphohistidine phosphatase SixA